MPRFGAAAGSASTTGKGSGNGSRPQKRPALEPKGAPKKKAFNIRMPTALQGLKPTTGDNAPICYAYNLQGCLKSVVCG
eukprot:3584251-Amphidinium_carterae.1